MTAQIKLNGILLEPISVDNGLRQGCCMAPVLFNLYACFVMERWSTRVQDPSVGVMINYKYDKKLFRRNTSNSTEMLLTDCQYADDAALLSTTRLGAMRVVTEHMKTSQDFGLSLSIPKTKVMAAGREVCSKDCSPIHTEHGDIKYVRDFTYLGSTIEASGKSDLEVDCRIAKASKTLGALRKAVFEDKNLTTLTKRKVYDACVLSTLLYSSESRSHFKKHLQELKSFHNRCLQSCLGISITTKWKNHISNETTRQRWGDPDTINIKLIRRRMQCGGRAFGSSAQPSNSQDVLFWVVIRRTSTRWP